MMGVSSRPSRASVTLDVGRPLGGGGMADVFFAVMRLDGKSEPVALKRIRAQYTKDPELVRHFKREAEICSLLQHPNIVGLRSFGQDAQGPYLALEFVDGCSASALVKKLGGQLSLSAVLCIVTDAARALDFAHHLTGDDGAPLGIVHRDVSPDNILVSSTGHAKLADFGIAKLRDSTRVTRTGLVVGKYGFIPPEVFEGKESDIAGDYYSFAATVFQLICGVPAFPGRTDAEVIRAVLSAEPPRLAALRPDAPAELSSWVDQALQKDPSLRPKRLSDLIDALPPPTDAARTELSHAVARTLASFERTTGISAPHTQTHAQERQRLWPSKLPRWTWALAGAISGLVVVGLGLSLFTRPSASPEPVPAPMAPAASPAPPTPPAVVAEAPPPAAQPTPKPATPRRPARAVPKPAPVEKVEKPAGTGTLRLRVQPWGEVLVGGQSKGVTPMEPLKLPAGVYTVVVVNRELNARRSFRVKIEPDKEELLKVVLP